jgi:hypothetical protein
VFKIFVNPFFLKKMKFNPIRCVGGIALLLGLFGTAAAQTLPRNPDYANRYTEPKNKGSVPLLHLNLGAHLPAGDLADRFGRDLSLGGGIEYLRADNWIFGVEGHYLFGQEVKDDPLVHLRTPDGDLIGANMELATVVLRQRGFYVGANVGKLLVFNEKKRSGLRVTGSLGWLQHWIRLQDDTQSLIQVSGDYQRGYDRLVGGVATQQFVGWQHIGPTRRVNWYAGFEFNQGFTRSRRDWDFATRGPLSGQRFDLRFGVRAGWTLPFYQKAAETIEY